MLVKGCRSKPIERPRRVCTASDNESCGLASYLNSSYLFVDVPSPLCLYIQQDIGIM
jgi:hypothetical protein